MKTLMGAVMAIPELGRRVYNGNAPAGTATPAGIYAVVSVQPGGEILSIHDQGDPALPDTVNQDYAYVAIFDSMRTGDNSPGDVTQRLYAVMRKVTVAARLVDTDHDAFTPLREPPRLRWTPRPMPDDRVANGQYITASFAVRTTR